MMVIMSGGEAGRRGEREQTGTHPVKDRRETPERRAAHMQTVLSLPAEAKPY